MSANGRGPLRLGDLVPETRPVLVERRGTTVTLRAYVNGRRCPGRVKAQVAQASQSYLDALRDARAEPEAAWLSYLCDVLLAVVQDIEYMEADVLSGRDDEATALLEALGWWTQDAEATSDPEAEGEGSTPRTTSSSPCCAAPITALRRRIS
jgi:hypothetical protein